MNLVTVYGIVGEAGGLSLDYDAAGPCGGHAFRTAEHELPRAGIRVTVDHDPRHVVGDLVHAEEGTDGRIRAVAVVDAALEDVDVPLHFSGEWRMTGPRRDLLERSYIADRARLIGLAIVTDPASAVAAAWPLELRPGDVRDPAARRGWPMSWRSSSPILRRAVEARATKSTGPPRIAAPPPHVTRAGGVLLADGVPVPVAHARRHAGGPDELGPVEVRPCGPILRVT